MAGILVRVGIDQTFGGWNAPVDPESGEFVYVPIPEGLKVVAADGLGRRFDEFVEPLAKFSSRHCKGAALQLPRGLENRLVHLDPDFEHLTYGDDGKRRGRQLAGMKPGDFIAFFAGLRPIRDCGHRLWYALIGFLTVERVCKARELVFSQRGCNAHTRKAIIADGDIVVFGHPEKSGRLRKAILIGGFRDSAYRVTPKLLREWGGLSVKDGYIQRSAVPPAFKDPARFERWFRQQRPELARSNHD